VLLLLQALDFGRPSWQRVLARSCCWFECWAQEGSARASEWLNAKVFSAKQDRGGRKRNLGSWSEVRVRGKSAQRFRGVVCLYNSGEAAGEESPEYFSRRKARSTWAVQMRAVVRYSLTTPPLSKVLTISDH
jgi:hypothetical protein